MIEAVSAAKIAIRRGGLYKQAELLADSIDWSIFLRHIMVD